MHEMYIYISLTYFSAEVKKSTVLFLCSLGHANFQDVQRFMRVYPNRLLCAYITNVYK